MNGWIIDIVFVVLILAGLIGGAMRGFVKSVLKLAGSLLAGVIAFFFCTQLAAALESWFGLTTTMASWFGGNTAIAYWLGVILSFVLILIIVKLLTWLLGSLGTMLVEAVGPVAVVNKILGALLGAAEALLACCIVLLILKWCNIAAVTSFLNTSYIVGPLYFSGWLEWAAAFTVNFAFGKA